MFKKVSELLESKAITQEVAEALDGEIGNALTKLRDENKTLRTEKEGLSKNYDEILKSKSSLEEQLSGIDEKIAQAKKDGESSKVKELEAERAKHSELSTSLENLQKANQKLTIDSGVSKGLSGFDVIDSEVVSTVLRQNVSMGEDGQLRYKNGETELSVEDGFKDFFENKPHLLKAKGEGGSGAGGGGGSGNIPKQDFGGSTETRIAAIEKMIASKK